MTQGNINVYSNTVPSPFSFLSISEIQNKNLRSPIYLNENYIKSHFNLHKYINTNKIFREVFKINKEGELVLVNKEILESQNGILTDVLKQAGMLIITGQNVVKMSLPIKIFQKKSQLERFSLSFTNLSSLHSAAKTNNPTSILEHLNAFMVGSLYYGLDPRKPFNPFLGETFQCYYDD